MTRAMIQASRRMVVLDLTAGRVADSWDSILAFSHWSKAVGKNADTPDIVLVSRFDYRWITALAVLIAQRLSVAWSKSLGMDVGHPFARRNLTRVVSGEPLYV